MNANGKKKMMVGIPTAATGLGVAGWLFWSSFGGLQADVKHNTGDIVELQKMPVQIAEIRTDIKNVEKRFDKFELKQEKVNDKMYDKLDKILEKVVTR